MTDSVSIGAAYRDQRISGGSVDNSPIGATTTSTGAFTTLSASGTLTAAGALKHTGTTVGVYGTVPVVQRPYSSAVHATSALVTSAGSLFVASHLAAIQEIQNTLIGLGIWATA